MHYPWWYVPVITSPMLIAVVSVFHMLIAHYAVGGGLFLAVETTYAYRTENRDYLAYLKRHAKFFVLLTVVLGAVSGVGIWWTIGLASPLATRVLIHTFVFGWATEYVFFVLEIVSAFVFYYYWGRLTRQAHVAAVWIYAAAAWLSLVIIGAITAFMLDPGRWPLDHSFWSAILNRQALPQIVSRTGGALLLSSLYVYLHTALFVKDAKLHALIEARSTRPALLGAILIAAGGAAWYLLLPESAKVAMYAASVLNVLMALLFAATGIVFLLLYFGPYRNPGWIYSPGFAAALLLFGLIGFSTGEFIREAVRKPYILYNVVLGSQMTPDEVTSSRQNGYLETSKWAKAYVQTRYPQLVAEDGRVVQSRLAQLMPPQRTDLGGMIFQYHCNDCHAIHRGYSAVGPLMQGWSREMILALVKEPNHVRFVMPPWSGTDAEAEILADYLTTIAPQRPPGMRLGAARENRQPDEEADYESR